jgi:Arc/MetJ-type ribon-helix-helix transcriptional regulator
MDRQIPPDTDRGPVVTDTPFCPTVVTRIMPGDRDDSEDELVEITVEVPMGLREEIDDLAAEFGYPNRSAFIRDVLRETMDPVLTAGAHEGVEEGYADVATGRTMSTAEVREHLGIDEH